MYFRLDIMNDLSRLYFAASRAWDSGLRETVVISNCEKYYTVTNSLVGKCCMNQNENF